MTTREPAAAVPRTETESALAVYGQPFLVLIATVILALSIFWGWQIRASSDFHVFYQSALDLRHGLNPYATVLNWGMPNANAPAFMLFLLPFGWLSRDAAFLLWTVAGLGAFAWSAWLTARELRRPLMPILLVACATQGLAVAVHSGQITLFLTPLLTLAWLADRRNQPRAGFWLGTLFYLKPFFGLFAVYLLWRRSYRALGLAVAAMAAWFAIGLAVAGVDVHRSWLASIGHVNQFAANVINASVRALTARLFNPFYPDEIGHYTALIDSPALEMWTWLLCIAIVLAVVSRVLPRRGHDTQWALLCVTCLLVSPLGWVYYVPMLVGPVAAAWRRSLVAAAVVAGVPAVWLLAQHFGVLGTVTIGSAFTWSLVLAWIGLLVER